MNTFGTNKREVFSTLWIFLTLNYLFCDVFTLMYSEELKLILEGKMGEVLIDQGFLLTFAILMEIPMAMILLSRLLPYRFNRIAHIFAGTLLTLIQALSLFVGETTLHYMFFSIIEISTTVFIAWYAWGWKGGTDSREPPGLLTK